MGWSKLQKPGDWRGKAGVSSLICVDRDQQI